MMPWSSALIICFDETRADLKLGNCNKARMQYQ